MSKILLINGSPNKNGSTNLALSEIAKELENNGVQSEILYLGKKAINDCIACFSCTKTGRCAIKDDLVNDIIERLDEFDGIVAGSPVYYAGPTARIQAFLTRLFFVGGNKFSGKIGASVLIARRGGASASFDRLNKFFTIANMFLAGSQYWNEAHAMTPDDLPKDEEGLQTMRTLAKNIAWFVKNKEFAKNAVAMPEYEKQILTNFIR